MLKLQNVAPGLTFGSVIFRSDLYYFQDVKNIWEEKHGPSFFLLSEFNPSLEYYQKEMGTPLLRYLVLTAKTTPRDSMLETKKWAQAAELKTSPDGNSRHINWDTGLLTTESFFLATSKSYSHRFYLGEQLFTELTLYREADKWMSLPWTYQDYLHSQKLDFLSWGRSFLLEKLLQKTQDLL